MFVPLTDFAAAFSFPRLNVQKDHRGSARHTQHNRSRQWHLKAAPCKLLLGKIILNCYICEAKQDTVATIDSKCYGDVVKHRNESSNQCLLHQVGSQGSSVKLSSIKLFMGKQGARYKAQSARSGLPPPSSSRRQCFGRDNKSLFTWEIGKSYLQVQFTVRTLPCLSLPI